MISEKVVLGVSLTMSKPNTISISNPHSSDSLKLITTIRQVSSPFPDRAVTINTTHTVLYDGDDYAFRRRLLASPVSVDDKSREISMYSKLRIHWASPPSGDPNIRIRDDQTFITIPPPGQGEQKIEGKFSPEVLFVLYKNPASLEEKLADFKPGERFEIGVEYAMMGWWTWGSLDTDLKTKKFSRWSFPEDLPLDRAPESDETEEMSRQLEDLVDGHDVTHLNSRSAVENEQIPQIGQMRSEGWVFGEPWHGLEVIVDEKAVFEFVE